MTSASQIPGLPDERGRFGEFGGRYVPETLMSALLELDAAYASLRDDETFQQELNLLLSTYVGRPTALYYAGKPSFEEILKVIAEWADRL